MADQPDVFSNDQASTQTTQTSIPSTQPADLLSSIKNEHGQQKYDSIEKALEGLRHSQEYIPQLKNQLSEKDTLIAELQAKLSSHSTLEDVVSRLQQQNQAQATETPSQASGLDQQAVEQLVRNMLTQEKTATVAEQNKAQVNNALVKRYGEKAQEVMASKARELGTTPQELGKLASQNPAMVMALFNTSSGAPSTTTTSLNTTSMEPERKPLARPEKSLLSGATSKQQREFMMKIKEDIRAKYNITE